MNVFIMSSGQDTGGQGYRIKRALDNYAPSVKARAMHVSETFIKYPYDLKWNPTFAQQLYDEADVVHHKNGLALYERFDHGQRKPTVMHHQGTRLRDNAEAVNAECVAIGAVQLVSTVDLLADVDDGIWLPSPYDLDALRAKYRVTRPNRRLRIGHAPTNRRAKGSDAILSAVDALSREYDIEMDLIEFVPWAVCMSRKGRCDIYIDQVTLGFGNNSIECFALGIPVVSGWADPADRARFVEQTGAEPPFVEATAENLGEQLARLIESAALRQETADRARVYAEQFHSERSVVEKLLPIYESAPRSKGMGRARRVSYRAGKQGGEPVLA